MNARNEGTDLIYVYWISGQVNYPLMLKRVSQSLFLDLASFPRNATPISLNVWSTIFRLPLLLHNCNPVSDQSRCDQKHRYPGSYSSFDAIFTHRAITQR